MTAKAHRSAQTEERRGRQRKKSSSINVECRAVNCEPFFQEQIAVLAELFKGSEDQ